MRSEIFLLLGSNLGDREKNLLLAIKKINENAGRVIHLSSIYTTDPWGVTEQPEFLNQVIEIETDFSPSELLNKLQEIEAEIGRKKSTHWGPREIDIDILFYGQHVILKKELVIPHPGIPERRFVLIPLCEIKSTLMHPLLKKRCELLLQECKDPLMVKVYVPTDS